MFLGFSLIKRNGKNLYPVENANTNLIMIFINRICFPAQMPFVKVAQRIFHLQKNRDLNVTSVIAYILVFKMVICPCNRTRQENLQYKSYVQQTIAHVCYVKCAQISKRRHIAASIVTFLYVQNVLYYILLLNH